MPASAYDLIVIGGGPAGQAAADAASAGGARIALVERDKLGGTCHNYGCDPTKTLLHVAHMLHAARHAAQYGLRISEAEADWPAVQRWMRSVLMRMQGGTQADARAATERKGIDVLRGEARFVSPHAITVGEQQVHAERFILAPGTVAAVPKVPGLAETGFITNIEAVSLPALPQRLAIIGSGAIGIEFAQLFSRFGVEVTVLESEASILKNEDRELADQLCNLLAGEGIRMETSVELRRVERAGEDKCLTLRCGNRAEETLLVDQILVAAGRRAALDGLDLHAAGVETDKHGIVVDKTLHTSVSHIWAAGDSSSTFQFTHVAEEQGKLAAQNVFAAQPQPFNDCAIPWVTYTSPELAHVGKTEAELQAADMPHRVARSPLEQNDRALATGQTVGLVKLLVGSDGRILGGHILAEGAGELLAPIVLAMRAGLQASQIAETILPYPTFVASVRQAAADV